MKRKIFNVLAILSISGFIFSITLGLILSRINFNPLKYYFRTDNTVCKIKDFKNINQRTIVKDPVRRANTLLDSKVFQKVKESQMNRGLSSLITRNLTIYDLRFLQNCEKILFLSADNKISQKFDAAPKTFKTFNELEAKLNNKVLLKKDNIYVDIRWNDLIDNLSSSAKQRMQKQLLDFYNNFFAYYTEEKVIQLVFTIIRKKFLEDSENVIAVTVSNIASLWQFIALSKEYNNESSIEFQFNNGFWTTNKIVTPIVHEYGHALENFYNSRKNMQNFFNKNSFPCDFKELKEASQNDEAHGWKYYNETCSEFLLSVQKKQKLDPLKAVTVSNFFVDWLAQQAGIKEILQQRLFAWSVVRSNYARTSSLRELFAEAFSQWLLTPVEERTVKWELLNKFFVEVLPNFNNF